MAGLPPSAHSLASRRAGVLSRDDLRALGCTRGQINGWLARGFLDCVHTGVYLMAGTPATPLGRHYAAVRRGGPGGRASGASALGLLAVDGFDLSDRPFVVVPPGRRLTNVAFDWTAAPVLSQDMAMLGGFVPGVTPARALLDAAGVLPAKRVRAAYDDLQRRGLLRKARFLERAHALVEVVPGAALMLEWAASGVLDLESEGERSLAAVFRPTDPQPLWQVWVLPDVRVDGLFPEARLAPEYCGERHHTIGADLHADAARTVRLQRELDIEVFPVRAADLVDLPLLRERILDRRAERIREGVTPLREFRLDR